MKVLPPRINRSLLKTYMVLAGLLVGVSIGIPMLVMVIVVVIGLVCVHEVPTY
jgi:hypothetical protein